ncbi:transglutaminase-like cysteine peptidase [Pseudomonas sp. LS1212]|uniref:transglutaminase-like cysteine peptidase n=1 Tax=Pseudomonas sp. LS1212 TaxID=2972478 RepID=UPI00215CB934|nr:transglutaminase-like cysteine peptidase [Pseudomonas sp. LS1212]UVJ46535.1 transglutaminase-like cysteine peptidase [Pseudomonas sp. LS1212]
MRLLGTSSSVPPSDVWEQTDYWASPLETLEQGAGDCEDFALAKYFTLQLLGISESNLRLVYTTLASTKQAHMVLGFWSDTGAEPVLLDNLNLASGRKLPCLSGGCSLASYYTSNSSMCPRI